MHYADRRYDMTRITKLLQSIEEHGYRGRIVPIGHLHDLKEEIDNTHNSGSFDEAFYQERLTHYVFSPPENLQNARSLIIVAVRRPQEQIIFHRKGKRIPVIIPPTYLYWKEIDRQVEKTLAGTLGTEGYRVARAEIPNKLLAVRSGLAVYGRNNITYVAGMGSFHQLVAFYSDLPCDEGEWQEPRMMELCKGCQACIRHCPSGAITTERFLLQAERCIVYHNEKPGNIPFPSWIKASWHNCMVGCMQCQSICPENKDFLEWIEDGTEFLSEETALIMEGTSPAQLPAETVNKLEESDLIELMDLLPRNLGVLFGNKA